jgi:hypothetical protein
MAATVLRSPPAFRQQIFDVAEAQREPRALSMRCSEVLTDFNMFGSRHEARRRLT